MLPFLLSVLMRQSRPKFIQFCSSSASEFFCACHLWCACVCVCVYREKPQCIIENDEELFSFSVGFCRAGIFSAHTQTHINIYKFRGRWRAQVFDDFLHCQKDISFAMNVSNTRFACTTHKQTSKMHLIAGCQLPPREPHTATARRRTRAKTRGK